MNLHFADIAVDLLVAVSRAVSCSTFCVSVVEYFFLFYYSK